MTHPSPTTATGFDVEQIRKEFPVLDQQVNGRPLVYLDNAATSQKPLVVINALVDYYKGYNANIHRGIHTLAEKATKAYEATRHTAQRFLNARSEQEIIFTRGVTEGLNLIASSYGRAFLKAGDEVIISGLEHHSNIVPWQIVCEEKKAVLKVIPVSDSGVLDMDAYRSLLSDRTKIVSVNHASNSLGTINPIREIIKLLLMAVGAVVAIDGAQAGAHINIDVQELDCDFYCLSAHKMYGPTGTGILYGKQELLEKMPPYQGGGEMIKSVTFEKTTYNDLPYKFEAGTPNIADVVAFKFAMDFIQSIGKEDHCGPRALAAGLWHREAFEDQRRAPDRHGAGKGWRIIVCRGGHSPLRHRADAGRARNCGTDRPPLHATADGPVLH